MKKIDIYVGGIYFGSTMQHKTCKSAVNSLRSKLQNNSKHLPYYVEDLNVSIKAFFDKTHN